MDGNEDLTPKKRGKTSSKAKHDYNNKAYDRIEISSAPKGLKEDFQQAIKRNGDGSVSAVLISFIKDYIEK